MMQATFENRMCRATIEKLEDRRLCSADMAGAADADPTIQGHGIPGMGPEPTAEVMRNAQALKQITLLSMGLGGVTFDTVAAPVVDAPGATPRAADSEFVIYDDTDFSGPTGTSRRPTAQQLGMQSVFGSHHFFRYVNGQLDISVPDEGTTRALAREVAATGEPLVIDIEHWPMDIRRSPQAEVETTMAKFKLILGWLRNERPALKIGFYDVLPLRDYWSCVPLLIARQNASNPWYAAQIPALEQRNATWERANAFIRSHLAEMVDFTCPSLYTFYDDRAGWDLFAKANIAEAKKVGKPVFPYLWMRYHEGNPVMNNELIAGDYWRQQLETVRREGAAGVMIWGGYFQENWDVNAAWVGATRKFQETLKK